MGMVKGFIQEFLETIGYELGYDWDELPSLTEMEELMKIKITPCSSDLEL
tara:strand:- start:77 stop:226 length:150 start_codon:yes stop_codon:yes gene_type:complete